MSATLIRLKKVDNDWTFSTLDYNYVLEYVPSPSTRGAYSYTLKRLRVDDADTIAPFDTLQSARLYISLLGFTLLDDIFNPDKENDEPNEATFVAVSE